MRVRFSLPAPVNKQKVLIVVGPTSSGKSTLAVELARKFNGEVISADSRQVYRGLDLGTGKITKREMKGVRHHLLDVASPTKVFTAHDFVKKARSAIDDISMRGKLPIIAGGTGFYIDALVGRIALPNVSANPTLRAQLEKKSVTQLFTMLKNRDARRAKTIEPHNKRRLIRALEIVDALGHVPTNDLVGRYSVRWIGLRQPIKELEKRITIRLLARLRGARNDGRSGMIAEARKLHRSGLSYKRMEVLGLEYRLLAQFLQKKISRAEMIAEMERNILRYAKKQLTYWRRNKSIRWFDTNRKKGIGKHVSKWLTERKRAH